MTERKSRDPQTLQEMLEDHNATLAFGHSESGLPTIEIGLPQSQIPYPIINCDNCDRSMRGLTKTSEFPFERRGVIIRFHNALYYTCNECGITDSPEDNTQGVIIGETLHLVTTQLSLHGISMKPPSLEAIQNALSTH